MPPSPPATARPRPTARACSGSRRTIARTCGASPRAGRRSALALAAAALLATLVLVLPATLAQRFLLRSYHESPARAVSDARRADALDWLSGRPQLALARARLAQGDLPGALAAARAATR